MWTGLLPCRRPGSMLDRARRYDGSLQPAASPRWVTMPAREPEIENLQTDRRERLWAPGSLGHARPLPGRNGFGPGVRLLSAGFSRPDPPFWTDRVIYDDRRGAINLDARCRTCDAFGYNGSQAMWAVCAARATPDRRRGRSSDRRGGVVIVRVRVRTSTTQACCRYTIRQEGGYACDWTTRRAKTRIRS